MKTKIALFIALLSALSGELIAGPTIILQGGGRRGLFDYVHSTDRTLVCRGSGSLVCPVAWNQVHERGVSYPVSEIVDFVSKQIEGGIKSGETMYEKAFQIKWESLDDGFQVELDVERLVDTNRP